MKAKTLETQSSKNERRDSDEAEKAGVNRSGTVRVDIFLFLGSDVVITLPHVKEHKK